MVNCYTKDGLPVSWRLLRSWDGIVSFSSRQVRMIKRILIAGGAGFLGSHLCERLVEDDHLEQGANRHSLPIRVGWAGGSARARGARDCEFDSRWAHDVEHRAMSAKCNSGVWQQAHLQREPLERPPLHPAG